MAKASENGGGRHRRRNQAKQRRGIIEISVT